MPPRAGRGGPGHLQTRRAVLRSAGGVLGAALVGSAAGCGRDPALPPLRERVRVGAYVHLAGHPAADPVAPADLAQLEAALGRRLDVVHAFWTWGRPFVPALAADLVERELLLSWRPDASVVRDLPAGRHDAYVDAFAGAVRDCGRRVHLRFAWEMNGSWMDWSAGSGGPSAQQYVAAWRHVVARFRTAGARDAVFIWCPNESDRPDRPGNRLEDYWPGSPWVDVLGFDAYNWSSREPRRGDGAWRSFRDIVAEPYRRVNALAPDKPVWLCEWGTTEAGAGDPRGASKAAWLRDAGALREFPSLTTLVAFSEDDQRDTQRDWRLDSSASAQRAFRDAFPARPRHSSDPTTSRGAR